MKKINIKKLLIYISLGLLFFFSNNAIVNAFIFRWENFQHKDYDNVIKYKYGVVLGGMTEYKSEEEKFEFTRSSNRIWKTLELYKKQKIEKILISGGKADFFRTDTIESALIKKYLISIGVPSYDIITEEKSKNTYENAKYIKNLINNNDTILLITSATHMRRSYKCFKKSGLRCDTYSTDYYRQSQVFNLDDLLIPSSKAFVKWDILLHEIVGVFMYKIAGYI